MVRSFLGLTLMIVGVLAEIVLCFKAAAAAHLTFWQYVLLNRWELGALIWHFNPTATVVIGVAMIGGATLFAWVRMSPQAVAKIN